MLLINLSSVSCNAPAQTQLDVIRKLYQEDSFLILLTFSVSNCAQCRLITKDVFSSNIVQV